MVPWKPREGSLWPASPGHIVDTQGEFVSPFIEIVSFIYFWSLKRYNITFHPSINSICNGIFSSFVCLSRLKYRALKSRGLVTPLQKHTFTSLQIHQVKISLFLP